MAQVSTEARVSGADAAALKRRKVRKGTHSCWECRRRKIRCQFAADNDDVCLSCQANRRACRSQEFFDENKTAKTHGLAHRLARVEAMMAKVMKRVMADEKGDERITRRERQASPTPSDLSADAGLIETCIPDDAPVGLLLGLRRLNAEAALSAPVVTPELDESTPTRRRDKHDKMANALHAIFPSQRDVELMVDASVMAATVVTALFSRSCDVMEGTAATAAHLRVVPPAASHPTVLARRLMQLAICMQGLPHDFDASQLQMEGTVQQSMHDCVTAVANGVANNDELVGTIEGLETVVLLGFWHANMGNLRLAWLSYRRAVSLAQLMGIHEGQPRSLVYAEPAGPRTHPTAVWYRITALDRRLSLLLSLPVGSRDDSFAADEAMARDTPMERLGKRHTVVAARIIERNATKSSAAAHVLTQEIDGELDEAEQGMNPEWWAEPDVESATQEDMEKMVLQVGHFDMLILLHLPYLLRDPAEGHEHAKAKCARASRAVLRRFLRFRTAVTSAFSCRHVDYSALIAAMTLLLAYLRHHGQPTQYISCSQRHEDRTLVEMVRERMLHVALLNRDQLSREAADMIGQMMPILCAIDAAMGAGVGSESAMAAVKMLHLNVPYLGTINIQPSTACSDMNSLSTAMAMHAAIPVDDQTLTMASPNDVAINGMFMQFEPQPPGTEPDFPDMTAEAADWAFQGVDTTYWSLLNNSAMDFAS